MNLKKTIKVAFLPLAIGALMLQLSSCGKDKGEVVPPFDPGQEIVCEDFSPTTGPISTKVILTGKNFGNDKNAVKVFFNQKEAPVISAKGDHILVMAPKLPGEDCVVKVQVGDKESTFKRHFDYIVTTNVTTVCGGDRDAVTNPVGTVALSSAQFKSKIDSELVCDKQGNLYFFVDGGENNNLIYAANIDADRLMMILDYGLFLNQALLAYDVNKDRCYRYAKAWGYFDYVYFDQSLGFAEVKAGNIVYPGGLSSGPQGMAAWACRQSIAMRPSDGMFYSRIYDGYLLRWNPETGIGEDLTLDGSRVGGSGGTSRGIVFDPRDDNYFYFTQQDQNAIYRYDINAGKAVMITGGTSGYLDGPLERARFKSPRGLALDSQGLMYVVDGGNHCIRKINLETGYVSTVVGLPQQAGYVNGTDEVAQFDSPSGICIDKDDVIYVSDGENHAIRRVAVE